MWDRGEAGPGVSNWVRERAKRREAGQRWGADTRARAAQHQAARFKHSLNWNQNSSATKLSSNSFKLWLLEIGPPGPQNFETKYGWKVFEIRNNFPYRDFLRFEMDLEPKFREPSMSWISRKIRLKNLDYLEFDETWPTTPYVQLIKGKNNFQANMGQEFEIPLKVDFGLISQ
jgi:hypothetical protein